MEEIKGKKHKIKNLVGQPFNELTVEEFVGQNKQGYALWKCKCSCGNYIEVPTHRLKNNGTKSCGCLKNKNDTLYQGSGDISGAYMCQLKHSAKSRNLEIDLDGEYLLELFNKQNGKCAISGVNLEFARNYRIKYEQQTASIDRIDSSKGYLKGNVQWVHKTVNKMKTNLSENEFKSWCIIIANNISSDNK